jgi:hypothetical protein
MAKRQVSKKARKATKTTSRATKKASKRTKTTSKAAKKTAAKKASKAAKKKPARSKSKAPWTAAQLRDYKALEKRATTLSESLTDADFDAKGDPVNPAWSRLLRDLDAWAAKYSVKLSKREHDHADSGGTGVVPMAATCPGSFQTRPEYHTTLPNGTVLMEQTTCILRRRGLFGRCVYSCTDGIYSV